MHRALLLVATGIVAVLTARPIASQARPTGRLHGVVLDPLLHPVRDARVTVRSDSGDVVATARSDGSGRFQLTKLPIDYLNVVASARGPQIGSTRAWPSDDGGAVPLVEVCLFDAVEVVGVVRDADGMPVAGAQVIAADDQLCDDFGTGFVDEAVTDRKGRFRLGAVPIGHAMVRASADGYLLGETEVELPADAKAVTVELRPGRGRELVVTVRGVPPARRPDVIGSLAVRRGGILGVDLVLPSRLARGTPGADGRWVVRGLPEALPVRFVEVRAEGLSFDPAVQSVEAAGDASLVFAARDADEAQAGATDRRAAEPTLRMVLRDADGQPVAGVQLGCFGMDSGVERVAVTAADGTIAVDGAFVDGEQIVFECRAFDWIVDAGPSGQQMPGDPTVMVPYRRGEPIRLLAMPAASITGVLRDADGKPAAGERVAVQLERAAFPGLRYPMNQAVTNARGEYAVGGLAKVDDAVYVVVESRRGATEAGPLRLPSDGKLADVDLRLGPALEVGGRVVTQRGVAVPGARVELFVWGVAFGAESPRSQVALTDREGRFAFRGVHAGVHGVRAMGPTDEPFAIEGPFEIGERGATGLVVRGR